LFAPTQTAVKNLEREHVFGKVIYTGDIAVEIIREAVQLLEARSTSSILDYLKLEPKSYILFTMHRSENTSSKDSLISVIRAFEKLSEQQEGGGGGIGEQEEQRKEGGEKQQHLQTKEDEAKGRGEGEATTIVFPIHPRTANLLKDKNLYSRLERCKNVKLIEPVGYLDFIKLMQNSKKIITDSGGAQKEAYLLSVPCITIRKNTEWIETVDNGWNILTDTDTNKIVQAAKEWMSLPDPSKQNKPIFGDGRTSTIIKDFIIITLQ
jgi:UDP-N-acetylglucosamine 2-epimerase (non-hydrolysing)